MNPDDDPEVSDREVPCKKKGRPKKRKDTKKKEKEGKPVKTKKRKKIVSLVCYACSFKYYFHLFALKKKKSHLTLRTAM